MRILVIEFADRLLLELPPSLGEYARAFFEKRGIEVRLGTGVREATGTAIVTSTGEMIGTRTVVATIGNAPTPMVAKLDLPNDRGRVRTDRALRVEGRGNVWALGDAALIPLVDAPSAREHYAPPTAQFAVREARRLAENVRAVLEGREPEPFVYTSKGALASLGGGRGVAEVFGVRLSGFPAWLLWRGYYLSFVPGFATKVRILVQWVLDLIVGRSTVQTGSVDAAGDALRALPRRRPGVRGGQPRRRLLRGDRGRLRADGARPGRRGDGPADRPRRALRRAGAARRGASHRHGAGARGSVVLVVGAEDFQRLTRALPPLRSYFDDYIAATFRAGAEVSRRRFLARAPAGFAANPCITFANGATLCRAGHSLRGDVRRGRRPRNDGRSGVPSDFPGASRGRATRRAAERCVGAWRDAPGAVWSAGACVAIGRDNGESGLVGDNVGEQRHERDAGS